MTVCRRCRHQKDPGEFNTGRATCKTCVGEVQRRSDAADPAATKAKRNAWYAANKHRIRPSERIRERIAHAADPEKHRSKLRLLRTTSPNTFLRSSARWKSEHRDRYLAGKALRHAVDVGVLTRPSACSRCGNDGNIQAHHADYTKRLSVEWLCSWCHGAERRIDNNEPSGASR